MIHIICNPRNQHVPLVQQFLQDEHSLPSSRVQSAEPGFNVNWGTRIQSAAAIVATTMVDPPPARANWYSRILNQSRPRNKLQELHLLREGGAAPPTIRCIPPLPGSQRWLARTIHHSRGSDFHEGRQAELWRRSHGVYWTKKLDIISEYRVHVWRTSGIPAIKAQVKVQATDGRTLRDWPRTHANGWIFKPLILDDPDSSLARLAKTAVIACSLDFGAVDIVTSAGGVFNVLEVNTSPGLAPGTAAWYAARMADSYRAWLRWSEAARDANAALAAQPSWVLGSLGPGAFDAETLARQAITANAVWGPPPGQGAR